jgi:hypothetical protein
MLAILPAPPYNWATGEHAYGEWPRANMQAIVVDRVLIATMSPERGSEEIARVPQIALPQP